MNKPQKTTVSSKPATVEITFDCYAKLPSTICAEVFKEMSAYMTYGRSEEKQIEFKLTLLNTHHLKAHVDGIDNLVEMFRPLVSHRVYSIDFKIFEGSGPSSTDPEPIAVGIF